VAEREILALSALMATPSSGLQDADHREGIGENGPSAVIGVRRSRHCGIDGLGGRSGYVLCLRKGREMVGLLDEIAKRMIRAQAGGALEDRRPIIRRG
jgi:hypothetical protein